MSKKDCILAPHIHKHETLHPRALSPSISFGLTPFPPLSVSVCPRIFTFSVSSLYLPLCAAMDGESFRVDGSSLEGLLCIVHVYVFLNLLCSDQRALLCIQLERLYHQRVLDNLNALQKQWGNAFTHMNPIHTYTNY